MPVATERERDFIDAIGAFYDGADSLDHAARALNYEAAMATMHEKYPDDLEAAAFYGLALIANQSPSDKTYGKALQAAKLLEQLFKAAPNHPGVAHYLIHALDYPTLATRALPAAYRYSKIAPAVSHAQHMPSHIFSQLGMWSESVDSNRGSAAAAREHGSLFDLAHALEWQVYAQLQTCGDEAALKAVEEFAGHDQARGNFSVDYARAALPARYALERRDWPAATSVPVPETTFLYAKSSAQLARALGALRAGDREAGGEAVAALAGLVDAIDNGGDAGRWRQDVRSQYLVASGWLAYVDGDDESAEALLIKAAELERTTYMPGPGPAPMAPAQELLGDFYLETGRPAQALAAYETLTNQFARRYNTIEGAARASASLGDEEKTAKYYGQLIELCGDSGSERPGLETAKGYFQSE